MALDFSNVAKPLEEQETPQAALDFSNVAQPLDFSSVAKPLEQPLLPFSERAQGVFERAGVYDTTQVKSFADSWRDSFDEAYDASIFSPNFKPTNTLNKALEIMSTPVTGSMTLMNEIGALANEGVSDIASAVAGAYKLLTTGSVKESKDLFESVREDLTFIKPKTETLDLAFDVIGKALGAGLSVPAIISAEGRGMVQEAMGKGYSQEQYDNTADAVNYVGTLAAIILPTVKMAKDFSKQNGTSDRGFDAEIAEAKAEAELAKNKPLEFEPAATQEPFSQPTPKEAPMNYEGGVDFYGEPAPAGARLSPEPTQGMELAPKARPETIEEAINQTLQQALDDRGLTLDESGGIGRRDKPDTSVSPDNTIPFEPATIQGQLDLPPQYGMEVDFRNFATPEQGLAFIQKTVTDTTPTKGMPTQLDMLGGEGRPLGGIEPNRLNASGESAASAEAISRLKAQNEAGTKLFEIDPERNTLIPLNTVDRVDKRAGQGRAIVQQDADGKVTVVENNSRLGNEAVTNRSKSMMGGVGKKGFGQGGAISFFGGKKPSLRDNISNLSKEEWISEFVKQYPDSANVAEAVYTKAISKSPSAPDSNLVKKFSEMAFDNSVVNAVDKGLGSSLTRLENVSPILMQRAVKFEKDFLGKTQHRVEAVTPFMATLDSLPKALKTELDSALIQNDFAKVDALIKQSPNKTLRNKWIEAKGVLNEMGRELQEAGVIEGLRGDYFPRIVEDRKGLLKTLGVTERTALEQRLKEAEVKRGKLDPLEEATIINQYLRGVGNTGYRPGFSKGRVFDEIPKELEQFYQRPIEALDTYLRQATLEVESARFFGKDAVKGPNGKLNIEESIGSYLNNEMNAGRIKPADSQVVHDILAARFGPGARGSNSLVQGLKDATNIGLLGDVMNAAIQIADIAPAIALNGIRPTLISIAHQFTKKDRVTAKDLGLINRIADEFISQRPSTKAVDFVFKYNGLAKIDALLKNVNLQSSYLGRQADVKAGGKAFERFQRDYAPRFGERFPELINDLREGRRTALTDELVFSELARRQPITRFNYPEMYLRMPNGRAIYTLKSFMLQQADLVRTQGYNLIKQGRVAEGLSRMAKLAIGLSLSNTAIDNIRNYFLGKPIDLESTMEPGNILAGFFKLFGYNDYFSDNVKRGAFGQAGRDLVAPPLPGISTAYDDLTEDLVAMLDGDMTTKPTKKSLKYIPFVGDKLYWSTPEGKQEALRLKMEAIKDKYGI